MYYAFVFALLLSLLGAGEYRLAAHQQALQDNAEAADGADNFGTYAHYALQAYDINPSYTGVIPTASLNLPSWYRPHPGLTAFVGNGHLFVFQPQDDAGAAGRVLQKVASKGGVVGLNLSGAIVSPANVSLMAAPVGIPELAVVQVVI